MPDLNQLVNVPLLGTALEQITPEWLGLGNVDNTADNDKYVAYAQRAGQADQTQSALTIRLNGGRTEGTDMWTFDGSTGRSINLSHAKLGVAPAVESTEYPGCYYRTVDGETEWINPPMNGGPYRTTERFRREPVYTGLDTVDVKAGSNVLFPVENAGKLWIESAHYTYDDVLLYDCNSADSPVSCTVEMLMDSPCVRFDNNSEKTVKVYGRFKFTK